MALQSLCLVRALVEESVRPECRICGSDTAMAGSKIGHFSGVRFQLFHCPDCGFAFIDPPWSGMLDAYDESYYRGEGVDWTVDYVAELEAPHTTIRQYEWKGFAKMIGSLAPLNHATQWLDYGCGNGGLVRYLRQQGMTNTVGFDTGWIVKPARALGIPILNEEELEKRRGQFDVVTMLEVVEHVADPLAILRHARRMLKPNGILYLTTGNAQPYRNRLPSWRYVLPEIHVSFFQPHTLATALSRSGFRPVYRVRPQGYSDMLRFKILKNLGLRKRSLLERAVPWRAVSFCADLRYRVTYHPYGIAVPEGDFSR